MKPVTQKQVEEWLALLTEEQRRFIDRTSKQSKKSKWLEVLARKKGVVISEDATTEELENEIVDWVLLDILDCGFGNRDYRCVCGKSLRHQYIVFNKKTNETYGLGSTCFQHHTDLSEDVVREIINGFRHIDLDKEEILYKISIHTPQFNMKPYLHIEGIPTEIIEQVRVGLPLTNRQTSLLERLKDADDHKRRIAKLFQFMEPKTKDQFKSFSSVVQEELLTKMLNDEYAFRTLPDGFQDDEIEHFLTLGLPLLDCQMEKIFEYNRKTRHLQVGLSKTVEKNDWGKLQKSITRAPSQPDTEVVSYSLLMELHLTTLKQIRTKENEQVIPEGLICIWEKVQDMVRQCKNGQEFDYSSFRVNLSTLCYALKIDAQIY